MRSPPRRRSAPPSPPPAVALALTACARPARQRRTRRRPPRPGPPPVAAARDVRRQTLKQRAEAAAAAILESFVVPPGGHRLAGPPDLPGGVLNTPVSYLGATWEVHVTDFWEAPGDPQALLAWEQGRLTPRFILGDAGFGPPVWDRGFQLAPEGALVTRELDVEVASAGGGRTGIRLDAWVAWLPPRWAGA